MHALDREHPLLKFEFEKWDQGYSLVIGIDEAGRGPLAGPVVACSVGILSLEANLTGVNDSKKLTPKLRKTLFEKLINDPHLVYGVGIVSHDVIDEINILEATKLAMAESVKCLSQAPDYLLVDGMPLNVPIPNDGIIKGDTKSLSIAAASIIAKETRDRMMLEYDEKWPGYDFSSHKGYGTKKHLLALKNLGPCPIHRKTFAPVKELLVLSHLKPELLTSR